jgi:hypothetical protein
LVNGVDGSVIATGSAGGVSTPAETNADSDTAERNPSGVADCAGCPHPATNVEPATRLPSKILLLQLGFMIPLPVQ